MTETSTFKPVTSLKIAVPPPVGSPKARSPSLGIRFSVALPPSQAMSVFLVTIISLKVGMGASVSVIGPSNDVRRARGQTGSSPAALLALAISGRPTRPWCAGRRRNTLTC